MRVLVTRPAAQANEWVQRLKAAGLDAEALPLIDIAPAADTTGLHAAWASLGQRALVVFVSPNAATCFFHGRPATASWPTPLRAASPGPGTTRVLRDLGVTDIVEPADDAPQFDSETLWQQLGRHEWQGREVLVVRGASGRDWLAERLRERGASVHFVAAYERRAPVPTAAQRQALGTALAEPSRHVWLFSSSEAIEHLRDIAPDTDWSRSIAVATHPRIAETARRLGLGRVLEARPSPEAVVACIQSLAP